MDKITPRSIEEEFGRLWPEISRLLLRYLLACRSAFDGDMDKVIILGALAQQAMKHAIPAEATWADMIDPNREPIFRKGAGSNVQSVADSTGIPRETVRRKVGELMELGWVARGEDGLLRPTAKAAVDLDHLQREVNVILYAIFHHLAPAPTALKDPGVR